MFNDFKVANYSKALLSPELYARHLSRLFSGDVADGLTVTPGTGLQVVLAPGNAMVRYGSANVASARLVSLVASFNLAIGTADVSNPRIDLVVVYIDNAVSLPTGVPTTANLDGLGVAKAKIVPGTAAASPVAANATAIQASVGSGNPYTVVAQVRVDAGVSVIASNKITDVRALSTPVIANGSIPFAKTSGIWWEEIGRTTIGTPTNTISVTGLPIRKHLHVIVTLFSTAPNYNIGAIVRFNNDSGSNYVKRSADNYGAPGTVLVAQSNISLTATTTINSLISKFDVLNYTAYEKSITGVENINVGNSSSNASVIAQFSAKWANTTAAVSQIDIVNAGTSQYAIGSEVIVLGRD
ncbi:hypothetical protein E3O62_02425 [Cryobacterium sp. TMT2-15-1]|uniref:hypothetical protein n=1 Tax=Cryobacterium sp. TMT2-15-1 TaxID=1259246 RepID=UPI00106C2715|nr:hypothetical protein [Cryobacterium sp. TMT2-15-1]TFC63702.1 hypothetical protein E3O62_02425 [Cryobacterium sp. TMT2-15-1]